MNQVGRLNPQEVAIRVPVPELSEDRRKEMVKVAGKYAKRTGAVRNVAACTEGEKVEKGGMSEEKDAPNELKAERSAY